MEPKLTFLIIVEFAIAFFIGKCISLRLLKVSIPPYAVRGSTAELQCEYDSGNSPLYSVKWFKDDQEFFRFIPAARRPYQVFKLAGLTVDSSSTKAYGIMLKNLSFEASGNYRCEVSTEGPEFLTVIGQGSMLVVEPLSSNPKLTGGKLKYNINDTVDLVCRSSPSRPAAHLNWLINGRMPIDEHVEDVGLQQNMDNLLTRTSRIQFKALKSHFIHGRLRVKCIASLSRPLNAKKNSKGEMESSATDLLSNQLLAHVFNKWEYTYEVSTSMKIEARASYVVKSIVGSVIIGYIISIL